jgi:hypothetical protein
VSNCFPVAIGCLILYLRTYLNGAPLSPPPPPPTPRKNINGTVISGGINDGEYGVGDGDYLGDTLGLTEGLTLGDILGEMLGLLDGLGDLLVLGDGLGLKLGDILGDGENTDLDKELA